MREKSMLFSTDSSQLACRGSTKEREKISGLALAPYKVPDRLSMGTGMRSDDPMVMRKGWSRGGPLMAFLIEQIRGHSFPQRLEPKGTRQLRG